jgi:hypothetical protein
MGLKKVFLVCFMLIAAAVLLAVLFPAYKQGRKMELIKKGVIRYICFDEYWQSGILYKRDKPLTMRVIIDGNKFYSEVEDALSFHGTLTSMYQIGLLKPDKAIVTHNFEIEMEKRLEDASVITDTLTLPTDCTPHYDQPTPRKELMMRTAVKTVQGHIEDWARKSIAKYPREVTLVIADFNIDYLMTYILVEPMNKVYRVHLHNPHDYDSDEYERGGWYPFGEQYNPAKSLTEKIRRHGIRKEIILDIPSID